MIPSDRDELQAMAGEYVLGLLEPAEAREFEAARPGNDELRRAIAFWEQKLHPLATLATPAEPPADLWNRIAARLDEEIAGDGKNARWWNRPAPWRWATGACAAVAAALLLFIALGPLSGPSYVAVLHAPQQQDASWIATLSHDGLTIRAVASVSRPADRAFEVWAIAPGSTQPQSLGLMPDSNLMHAASVPPVVRLGTTLAISVEPSGGSPTHQPTGPVVFVGAIESL
jgi:anti-sigma-K factor RskA